MQRYLLKFSYLGTRFRGLQRQPGEVFRDDSPYQSSVQTLIENSLLYLKPANSPTVYFSSRTDKGVHCFANIAHVDIEHYKPGSIYSPQIIQKNVNRYCEKANASLIVSEVLPVPDTFHSRYSSSSRHYMYRIAVSKSRLYPIVEWRRSHFVHEPFCLEKVQQVCSLFQGTKDFASFCHLLSSQPSTFPTVRSLNSFTIQPGKPLIDPIYDRLYDGITFYEIHVKGRSFMYKQVRRMVAVLIAAAQGRMSIDQVQQLFDKPGVWNPLASTAPAHGLYLLDVQYEIPPPSNEPLGTVEDQRVSTSPCDHSTDSA